MAVNELEALTTSIGEHSVVAIGKDKLRALEVVLDPREMSGSVTVVLLENSTTERKRVIGEFLQLEELFYDECVLSLRFADSIDASRTRSSSVPAYSLK